MTLIMVGVLTSLLSIFQLSQDKQWYIKCCSVNERIYGDENNRAKSISEGTLSGNSYPLIYNKLKPKSEFKSMLTDDVLENVKI